MRTTSAVLIDLPGCSPSSSPASAGAARISGINTPVASAVSRAVRRKDRRVTAGKISDRPPQQRSEGVDPRGGGHVLHPHGAAPPIPPRQPPSWGLVGRPPPVGVLQVTDDVPRSGPH